MQKLGLINQITSNNQFFFKRTVNFPILEGIGIFRPYMVFILFLQFSAYMIICHYTFIKFCIIFLPASLFCTTRLFRTQEYVNLSTNFVRNAPQCSMPTEVASKLDICALSHALIYEGKQKQVVNLLKLLLSMSLIRKISR